MGQPDPGAHLRAARIIFSTEIFVLGNGRLVTASLELGPARYGATYSRLVNPAVKRLRRRSMWLYTRTVLLLALLAILPLLLVACGKGGKY